MAHSASRLSGQQTNNDAPRDAEWRILAKETAQENDSAKLIEIVDALNRALDEQNGTRKQRVRATDEGFPSGRRE
jgi:hypothetical protein